MNELARNFVLRDLERRAPHILSKKLDGSAVLAELNMLRLAGRLLADPGVGPGSITLVRGGLALLELCAGLEEHEKKDKNALFFIGKSTSSSCCAAAGPAQGWTKSRSAT